MPGSRLPNSALVIRQRELGHAVQEALVALKRGPFIGPSAFSLGVGVCEWVSKKKRVDAARRRRTNCRIAFHLLIVGGEKN